MYRAILLSVTGLLLVSQSAKADICNAAFVQAISDVYQLDSKTLLKRQLKERFCRDYASAGSKSIGVSYAGFGLDYGDSSSTAESFCRSRDENIEFQDMESVAYKSVNPENLKLLVGCLPGFKIENRSVTFDATTVRVSYVSSTNLGESHVLVSATNGDGEPCNFSPQSLIGPAGQDLVCKRSQRARLNGDKNTILHKETAGSKPVSHTVDVPADRVFTVEYNADQIRRGNTWLLRCKEKGQLMFETLYRTRPVDRGLLEQSRQSGDPTTDFLCRGTQCSVRGEYNAYCRAKLGPLRVVIGTTEQVKQLANTWSARVVEEPKKGATSVKLQCVRDNVVLEPTIMCRDSGPNKCSFEYFKIATCWNQFQDNFPKFQDDIGEKAVKILEMSKGR